MWKLYRAFDVVKTLRQLNWLVFSLKKDNLSTVDETP